MQFTTVHVSTQRSWHGGEEQARLLIRGLAARGHRCLVLARSGGEFARRMGKEGFEVHCVQGIGRGPRAMWQTRRWLRLLDPDVVHFHDPHALSGAGMAAWGLPIPVRVVARRVDFTIRSPWKYRQLTDRVIAVSSAVADVCRTSGLEAGLLRVVHDGVDPARVRSGDRRRGRESLGLAYDEPLLLCIATLTDHKGHTYLLQALPAVLARFPQVRLMLAGDGELRDALEAETRKLGIAHSVAFLGFRRDVPDLLRAADLFVMPSHMEGLCSTLIDAMFARVPIVATRAGGIPEVLGGDSGTKSLAAKLVPPRDPAALAAAINEALAALSEPSPSASCEQSRTGRGQGEGAELSSNAALREMLDHAEARAARLFTADKMVEGTLAVYEEVLAANRLGNEAHKTRRAA